MTKPLQGRKAVVAKLGMDAHWRGVIVVAYALRDAGMEVIYLGHASPAHVASVVLDEDADLLGVSSLSGNHLEEAAKVVAELERLGVEDVPVVLGGTVPPSDVPTLNASGVDAVFSTGTPLPEIISEIAQLLATERFIRT